MSRFVDEEGDLNPELRYSAYGETAVYDDSYKKGTGDTVEIVDKAYKE